MKEKTASENRPGGEESPALFVEEKQESPKKGKGKFFLILMIVCAAFAFWPKGHIQEEAVLHAERFAKLGLTSSGVLSELLHGKGAHVTKGTVLARFENPDLARRVEEKKLELEILRIEKERLTKAIEFQGQELMSQKMLFENGVIGRAVFERTQHELDAADQLLKIKSKEMEGVEKGLEYLKSRVESLTLKSPFDGVLLTDPGVLVGTVFQEGEFVLEFADPKSYFLEVLIPEKQIHKVRPGNRVRARFQAYPWEVYEGEVVRLAPRTVDEIEKVFKIKHVVSCEIQLEGLPSDIRYGMRASVTIRTDGKGGEIHDDRIALSN